MSPISATRLRTPLRLLLAAAAASALAFVIAARWDDFVFALRAADAALLLALLPAATLLTLMAPSGWHLILRALGSPLRWAESTEIWMVSAVARFVPGGIWSFAGRFALTAKSGVSTRLTGVSLYIETALIALTSFAAGIPALLIKYSAPTWMGFALLAGAVLLGLLLPHSLGATGKWRRTEPVLPSASGFDRPWRLCGLGVFYLAYWVLWGAVLALFASAFQPMPAQQVLYVVSSFALAYCAGFVVLVVPGGLGIREGVLFTLLTEVFTPASALAISVSLRLWMIAAEIPALLIALALAQRARSRP